MTDNKKYVRIDASKMFIICTERYDNVFGSFVLVKGLMNNGTFENFDKTPKTYKYRFSSGIMADMFFETMNLTMNCQKWLRNCLAPIDYSQDIGQESINNWVDVSPCIGPYLERTITGNKKTYNRDTELQKLAQSNAPVIQSPNSSHIILDTAQMDKNGISYVCNLLVKPEEIESGYNPNKQATVEIIGFASIKDADYYAKGAQLSKDIAQTRTNVYNTYAEINRERMDLFPKVMELVKTKE